MLLFLGTSTLQNYSRSLGLHSPILMACTYAPEQRALLTSEQLHQLERAFYLAKCAGSWMGKLCPTKCDFCNAFFCREISNASKRRMSAIGFGLECLETMSFPSQYGVVTVPFTFQVCISVLKLSEFVSLRMIVSYMVTKTCLSPLELIQYL
jgi:hypothetical protein